jgi:hypothetical protein
MSEIHINKADIKSLVESFSNVNTSFAIKSYVDKDTQQICEFYINGKECKIIFYIKENTVKIQPTGKNIEECNILKNYIETKGFSTDIAVNQIVFSCSRNIVDDLIKFITEECIDLVNCSQNDNIYRFTGYHGDKLTFTFYPQTNKAMIQGKPFLVYSIVLSYLSSLSEFSFDQIVDINNTFINLSTSSSSIREEIKYKLGSAYSYMDEALLKSISGSLTLLKLKTSCEDYTGCVTGVFKALEGYLKKILIQNFNYKLERNQSFSMFHRDNRKPSIIELDTNIHKDAKQELNKLYLLYQHKRNVYLHTTADPSLTRIIETLEEAQDLSEEILLKIKESHSVIFK